MKDYELLRKCLIGTLLHINNEIKHIQEKENNIDEYYKGKLNAFILCKKYIEIDLR